MKTKLHSLLFILSAFFCTISNNAQTTLASGDIAVVYHFSELSTAPGGATANADRLGIVLLKDIDTGTTFNITENGSNNGTSLEFDEGVITFTAQTALSAGTVIDFESQDQLDLGRTSSIPLITDGNSGVNYEISTSGDQTIIYTGSNTSPTFIYSAFFDGTSWDPAGACAGDCSSAQSQEPTSGVTFAYGADATTEFDNNWYTGPTTFNTTAEALAAFSNIANWTGSNNVGDGEAAADALNFSFSAGPPNDNPESAELLTVGLDINSNPVTGTNVGATNSTIPNPTGCPFVGSDDASGDIWYAVVVPSNGILTIETQAANPVGIADTVMAVYSGDPNTTLTQVPSSCTDDEGTNAFSLVNLTGQTPGDTLYIRVWEYANDAFGTFQISAYTYLTTNVPDDNFENYLETHDASGAVVALGDPTSMGNGVMDDYVLTSAIETVISLNVNSLSITDLTGIEDFTALVSLFCIDNQLTVLDFSQNTNLEVLDCGFNLLTSLDVSSNSELNDLRCGFNPLTTLDVSNNTLLTYINCRDLNLTVLDVSNNSVLTGLRCLNNQLSTLYLNNGNNANFIELLAGNNPNLECIKLDNQTIADDWNNTINTPSSFNVDAQTSFSTKCDTFVPDDNFENYLETHNAAGATVALGDPNSMGNGIANDDFVFTTRIDTVTILNVPFLNIADLTGIEDFISLTALDCGVNNLTELNLPASTNLIRLRYGGNAITNVTFADYPNLEVLHCQSNGLTVIDVSQNVNLENFRCHSNQLTTLDVSQNANLDNLRCDSNQLTTLDVSQNTVLNSLDCSSNQLTTLNVSQNANLDNLRCDSNQLSFLNIANGNNPNFFIVAIGNNPSLTCVTVDDPTIANNWNSNTNTPFSLLVDPQTSFSTNCNQTVVQPIVYLQGAFLNSTDALMRDDLRANNYLPTTSPYTDNAPVSGTPFTTTGANAIVDWVWVELRDDTDNTQIIEGKSALLQRDGDIVDVDGISPLIFLQPAKHYNVVINHRNHLGIMSSTKQAFPLNESQNFSNGSKTPFGTNAMVNINGTMALWAGDANGDGKVNFSGDVNLVTTDIILFQPANTTFSTNYAFVDGYFQSDVFLDSNVSFSNETNQILLSILLYPLNTSFSSQYNSFNEQLPSPSNFRSVQQQQNEQLRQTQANQILNNLNN